METVQKQNAGQVPLIQVENLTMGYGSQVIQKNLNFEIPRGSIFIIMGNSGCGKSTFFRHCIGLLRPMAGRILRNGRDLWTLGEAEREALLRTSGVLYQGGALWTSMTLAENVALPLQQFTDASPAQIWDQVEYRLSLVGLGGCGDLYPSEISGGMRKRAGLARAMALEPELLFLDEPSAGLDPLSARRLDDLILELRNTLGCTIVVISHDLDSLLAIGDDGVFLDGKTHQMIARGCPRELKEHCADPMVRHFLSRGKSGECGRE